MRFTASALTLGIALSATALPTADDANAADSNSADSSNCGSTSYDYIVVGSGPGGGPLASNLARAGYKTLLIEAGADDTGDPSSNVPAYYRGANIHANLHWDFYVKHYADPTEDQKYQLFVWKQPDGQNFVGPAGKQPTGSVPIGINYPRGATLGGSSIINAAGVFLPNDDDWNYIARLTGDKSWNSTYMRSLFQRLEHNDYLPAGTPGHGFNGYLDTMIGNGTQFLPSTQATAILKSMVTQKGLDPDKLPQYLLQDANYLSPTRDTDQGLYAFPFHTNKTWGRVSARDRILSTYNAVNSNGQKKYPLSLALNTLVSKVLFSTPSRGQKPCAIGVEVLQGASLYKGDTRHNNQTGVKKQIYAKREVIIAGGSFNSPQILQLSGIGPKADLQALKIPVVVDLPGVGTNMQDNLELDVVGLAKQNITYPPTGTICTFNGVGVGDPCYAQWLQGQGRYSYAGINADAFLFVTNHSIDGQRDEFIFSGNFEFRGFQPASNNTPFIDPPNTWGMSTVKMHPQNFRVGTVKLRSTDPTDTPLINFNYFNTSGAAADIGAMKDVIAYGRRSHAGVPAPVGPLTSTEPPCAQINADGSCAIVGADEDYIRHQTFGHHVSCSNSIGADGDPYAVLDSKFRVRGVDNLRVVDASALPRISGAFPVISVFMISEKASDLILSGQ